MVSLVALLRFRVLGMCQGNQQVFSRMLNTGIQYFPVDSMHTSEQEYFASQSAKILQSIGKRGKASLLVLCPAIGIRDTDTGKYPGFVNVQSTAVFAENFESHLPPSRHSVWGGSAGTGHPAKSSRFERDKFTGCCHAPFVDALTGGRII